MFKQITLVAAILLLNAAAASGGMIRTVGIGPGYTYGSITAAMTAADCNDVIVVASGHYSKATTGESFPLSLKPGVTLRGNTSAFPELSDLNAVVLHGDLNEILFVDGRETGPLPDARWKPYTTRIEYLAFTEGKGHPYVSSQGRRRTGGAVFLRDANLTISHCLFQGNTSEYYGGALSIQGLSPRLEYCLFQDNSADPAVLHYGYGGALFVQNSAMEMKDCQFLANTSSGTGGAIAASNCNMLMERGFISNNTAINGGGGGIHLFGGGLQLANLAIAGNRTAGGTQPDGGGLYLHDTEVTMIHCTIAGNAAGTSGQPGRGGAMFISDISTMFLANTISWSNFPNELAGPYPGVDTNTVVITHCDLNIILPKTTSCLNQNPGLNSDYKLVSGSSCADAGVHLGVTADSQNELRPNPVSAFVDIGWDEFYAGPAQTHTPTPVPTFICPPSSTPSRTPTRTPTDTPTPSMTPTQSPTPTGTATNSPTRSPTSSATPTRTPTGTSTAPVMTPTAPPTLTPSPSVTHSPTLSPTPTSSPTPVSFCATPVHAGTIGFGPSLSTAFPGGSYQVIIVMKKLITSGAGDMNLAVYPCRPDSLGAGVIDAEWRLELPASIVTCQFDLFLTYDQADVLPDTAEILVTTAAIRTATGGAWRISASQVNTSANTVYISDLTWNLAEAPITATGLPSRSVHLAVGTLRAFSPGVPVMGPAGVLLAVAGLAHAMRKRGTSNPNRSFWWNHPRKAWLWSLGIALLLPVCTVEGAVRTVGVGGTAVGYQYGSITEALADAAWSDTILIAKGYYSLSTTAEHFPLTLKAGVTLQGRSTAYPDLFDANAVILAGDANAILVADGESHPGWYDGWETRVAGLVLALGRGHPEDTPAGRIRRGGALFVRDANIVLTRCRLINNSCEGDGGGMYISGGAPRVDWTVFESNSAGISPASRFSGGGLRIEDSRARFTDIQFLANLAYGAGGGMAAADSDLLFQRAHFGSNSAAHGEGGGMLCNGGSLSLENVLFKYNSTSANSACYGGAMSLHDTSLILYHGTFVQNIAQPASGTGLGTGGGVRLAGRAMFNTIGNSIFWDNLPDEIADVNGSVTVIFSDVQGGWPGPGNFSLIPDFVSSVLRDFRLLPGSPCVNTGQSAGVVDDFQHDPRPDPVSHLVDIGWDEYQPVVVETLTPSPIPTVGPQPATPTPMATLTPAATATPDFCATPVATASLPLGPTVSRVWGGSEYECFVILKELDSTAPASLSLRVYPCRPAGFGSGCLDAWWYFQIPDEVRSCRFDLLLTYPATDVLPDTDPAHLASGGIWPGFGPWELAKTQVNSGLRSVYISDLCWQVDAVPPGGTVIRSRANSVAVGTLRTFHPYVPALGVPLAILLVAAMSVTLGRPLRRVRLVPGRRSG